MTVNRKGSAVSPSERSRVGCVAYPCPPRTRAVARAWGGALVWVVGCRLFSLHRLREALRPRYRKLAWSEPASLFA